MRRGTSSISCYIQRQTMSVRSRKVSRYRSAAPERPFVQRIALPAILVVTFLVYVRSLWFEFVFDDFEQIVLNGHIQSWRFVPAYFTSHVWSQQDSAGLYYRPIFLLWLRLNHAIFELSPGAFHFSSICMHVTATALLYFVVRKLVKDGRAAAVAALLFGVHPLHNESVAWVSGVTDPLAACGIFASLLCFLRWQESESRKWQVWAVVLFVAAILSKETAVVLVLVIAALVWMRERQWKSAALELLPFVGVVLVYLGMRLHALHVLGIKTQEISLRSLLLTWPFMTAHYLRILVVPSGLSPFYDLQPFTSATFSKFFLPLAAVLIALGGIGFMLRKLADDAQKAAAVVSLILIALPLTLALQLNRLPPASSMQDRYMYIPSAGAAVLIAMLLVRITRPRVLVAVTLAVAAIFSAITIANQDAWQDNVNFYAVGVSRIPRENRWREAYATALMSHRRCTEAIPAFEDVVAHDPQNWKGYANIGNCYLRAGDIATGEKYLIRAAAITQDPTLHRQLEAVRQRLQREQAGQWGGSFGQSVSQSAN